MTPAAAKSFLQHKYAWLIENTWSVENEEVLRSHWEPIFAGLDDSTTLAHLQTLDRAMEKAVKQFVLREDRANLRETLSNQFGLCG